MRNTIIKKIYYKLLFIRDNFFAYVYILLFRTESYQTLKRIGNKYHRSTMIKRKLANLTYNQKKYNESLKYWKDLYKLTSKLTENDFITYISCLKYLRKNEKNLLEKANLEYPNNLEIIYLNIKYQQANENWLEAYKYFEKYKIMNGNMDINDKLQLLYCYLKVNQTLKFENLQDSLMNDFNDDVSTMFIQTIMDYKDWSLGIKYIETYLLKEEKTTIEQEILLFMFYGAIGEKSKSINILNRIIQKKKIINNKEENKFQKLILYDNGETRIELYKKLMNTDKIIVTFDAINMEWDGPSFAFKLLQNSDMDIVAIRKRKAKTYQQDLQQEDFLRVVKPIVNNYQEKLSYGFSLGAYNALYFASILDCRILALSPRLSIHPVFGQTKLKSKNKMKQNLCMPKNREIEPVIVYDPKNNLDNKYINEGILPFFPNARLIKMPYCGHGVAPQLLNMGELKEFVNTFLEGKTPKYNRKLRVKSDAYFRNLSKKCYNHNKIKWALNLVNESLRLNAENISSLELKYRIYMKEEAFEQAHLIIKILLDKKPHNLKYNLFEVDVYLALAEYTKAKQLLNNLKDKHSGKKGVMNRLNKINLISNQN